MQILISNDDGVYAPGIAALHQALQNSGHDLCVVAPDRNRSGASHSLTLDRPLEAHTHHNGFISINGTPTDCVHLGVSGLFSADEVPDIVVSGINAGANLGDDVIYSGTVAAAMEGRNCRYPAIAVSLASSHPENYATAGAIVSSFISKISQLSLPPRTVLNINVPDLPLAQIQGIHITRLGHRVAGDAPIKVLDPRGRERYWIAGVGAAEDKEPGTDFFAVEHGFVSVTPLQIDMTHYSGMDNLANWLEILD